MKSSCVSQLELLPPGFESSFAGACAEAPTAIALPAVDAIRSEERKAVSPAGSKQPRRASVAAGEVSRLEALLTFSDAALSLGISLRQFRRLVDSGKIAFVKVSERAPRVRPRELQRFLDASMVKYSEVKS